jgi:hypothetical protein
MSLNKNTNLLFPHSLLLFLANDILEFSISYLEFDMHKTLPFLQEESWSISNGHDKFIKNDSLCDF